MTPPSVAFDAVVEGGEGRSTVRIKNTGTYDLEIASVGVTGGGFSAPEVPGAGTVVTSGNDVSFDVVFTPGSVGSFTGTLSVTTENGIPSVTQDVALSGMGKGNPEIVLSARNHDFGDVDVNSTSSPWTLWVQNAGNVDLVVDDISLSGENGDEFDLAPHGAFEVAPGGEREVVVQFEPTSVGSKEATLTIASNDPDPEERSMRVLLTGRGTGESHIALSDTAYDFGDVAVGDLPQKWQLGISNEGNVDLEVLTIVVSGADDFVATPSSFSVMPEANSPVTVTFEPQDHGSFEAALQIESNDPNASTVQVALRGRGMAPDISLSADNLSFESVSVDGFDEVTLVVSNGGNLDLMGSISCHDSDFYVSNPQLSVVPEGNQKVMVTFRPQARYEEKLATLVIESNDPDQPSIKVPLYTGLPIPILSLSEESHVFDRTPVESSSLPWSLVISNVGIADLVVERIVSPNWFSWVGVSLPDTIASGESDTVRVSFEPLYDSSVWGDGDSVHVEDILRVYAQNDTVDVMLKGVATRPIVDISTELVFEDVWVADTLYYWPPLRISNDGTALLVVEDILSSDTTAFMVEGDRSFSMAPGGSKGLTVRFTPGEARRYLDSLSIRSNDPVDSVLVVDLRGRGVKGELGVDPDSLVFDDTPTHVATEKSISIRNTGDGPLMIDDLGIEEGERTFILVSSLSGEELAAGGFAEIKIRFFPVLRENVEKEVYEGMLRISFRTTNERSEKMTVVLSGTGISVPLRPVLPEGFLDFGSGRSFSF